LNFFTPVSITPRKLTYLYQKFYIIAIWRWSHPWDREFEYNYPAKKSTAGGGHFHRQDTRPYGLQPEIVEKKVRVEHIAYKRQKELTDRALKLAEIGKPKSNWELQERKGRDIPYLDS